MSQPNRMRVVIAYDGTLGAALALEEMRRRRAGLSDAGDAVVLTVADLLVSMPQWVPGEMSDLATTKQVQAMIESARRAAAEALKHARGVAKEAAASLREALPGWTVEAQSRAGSAASEIITLAREWGASLVVVGSRGQKRLARWLLGSVAQQVLNEAPCSVRVVRGRLGHRDDSACVVVGMDGSPGAWAAVDEMARRSWPDGSTAHVVATVDWRIAGLAVYPEFSTQWSLELERQQTEWMTQQAQRAVDRLQAAGLAARAVIRIGDAKDLLLREIKRVGADALVIGATGRRGVSRVLMGSVSTALALRAPCVVEVVRPSRAADRAASAGGAVAEPNETDMTQLIEG